MARAGQAGTSQRGAPRVRRPIERPPPLRLLDRLALSAQPTPAQGLARPSPPRPPHRGRRGCLLTHFPRALALFESLIGSRAYFVIALVFFSVVFGSEQWFVWGLCTCLFTLRGPVPLPHPPTPWPPREHTHTHTHTHIHTHTQYTHDHIPALHIAARTLTDTSSMDAFSPAAGAAVLPAFAPPTSAPATFEVQHTVGHM